MNIEGSELSMEEPVHHKVNVIAIFVWLTILTAIEVGVTFVEMPKKTLVIFLIGSALVKATLVGVFFMHLKFEGWLIRTMLILTCLMGGVFLIGLFPDLVIGYWKW